MFIRYFCKYTRNPYSNLQIFQMTQDAALGKKPKVLFITPVIPNVDGGGTEKRAHHWLTHLNKSYNVEVLFVSTLGAATNLDGVNEMKIVRIDYPPLYRKFKLIKVVGSILLNKKIESGATAFGWLPLRSETKEFLKRLYKGKPFEKIICFRTFCTEFALYINQITKTKWLEMDSDDLESQTRRKLAILYAKNNLYSRSAKIWFASRQYDLIEHTLKLFNHVYVCSPEDEQILVNRLPGTKISTFRNKILDIPREHSLAANRRSILFVGSLNYYPNEHAILWFVKNVFLRLKAENQEWEFNIAGFSASVTLKQKLNLPGVVLHSNLPSLDQLYDKSSIIIAPLFAGGGTKLKVIEAMSFRRPVVATYEAVHGLGLEDGKHYLLGSTKELFYEYCKKLAEDNAFHKVIREAAHRQFKEEFSYKLDE